MLKLNKYIKEFFNNVPDGVLKLNPKYVLYDLESLNFLYFLK